jgi:hypothetical protein
VCSLRASIDEPTRLDLLSATPRLLVSLCGSRLVAGAILNDVGTGKKQLTHAYVVPLMCHGMLRRDVKVAHTTLQW